MLNAVVSTTPDQLVVQLDTLALTTINTILNASLPPPVRRQRRLLLQPLHPQALLKFQFQHHLPRILQELVPVHMLNVAVSISLDQRVVLQDILALSTPSIILNASLRRHNRLLPPQVLAQQCMDNAEDQVGQAQLAVHPEMFAHIRINIIRSAFHNRSMRILQLRLLPNRMLHQSVWLLVHP